MSLSELSVMMNLKNLKQLCFLVLREKSLKFYNEEELPKKTVGELHIKKSIEKMKIKL